MILYSASFADGAALPFECAYDADNSSPSLQWMDVPGGTACLSLICQDPIGYKGRPWTHWLLWNIPAWVTRLSPGQPAYPRLEDGTVQGINDYLELGWGGPCPPDGTGVHRYVFTLLALDAPVYPQAPNRDAWEKVVDGHVLGSAVLSGYHAHDSVAASYEAVRHPKSGLRVAW